MKLVYCLIAVSLVSACSVKTKRKDYAPEQPQTQAAAPAPAAEPAAEPAQDTANEAIPEGGRIAAATDHAAPAAHEVKGVAAEKSLRWLTNGNTRFVKHQLRKDGQSRKDINRLSSGQQPHAIVLSCSDSRVPPEIVFDQKLGEIFTVRTAGQALGANAIGSIEYAVEHLGAHLIVVMGHTSCGAVKAAHSTLEGASAGTESLDELVHDIHPRIASFKGQAPSEGFEKESWANAHGVAGDLLERSKMLARLKDSGEIKVVPALYNLKTGKVTFHDDFMPDVRTPAGH